MSVAIVSSVIAAIAGALVGRAQFLDWVLRPSRTPPLIGDWAGEWQDVHVKQQHVENAPIEHEVLHITHQRGSRVTGYITVDTPQDQGKKWEFEGELNGRFLQVMYFPESRAASSNFLDYGCYFFEQQGDGSFLGYSIGFSWYYNCTGASIHKLRKIV